MFLRLGVLCSTQCANTYSNMFEIRMLLLDLVLYLLAPNRCHAHGKLTVPTPRDGISTGRAGLDQNNPVSFESGCDDENTCDAFVCSEAAPNPNVPVTVVSA